MVDHEQGMFEGKEWGVDKPSVLPCGTFRWRFSVSSWIVTFGLQKQGGLKIKIWDSLTNDGKWSKGSSEVHSDGLFGWT